MANSHGGKRSGAGRPAKAEEITLIKKIDQYVETDVLLQKLLEIVNKGRDSDKIKAIKIILDYRWGKPKETKDITLVGEQPIFNIEL